MATKRQRERDEKVKLIREECDDASFDLLDLAKRAKKLKLDKLHDGLMDIAMRLDSFGKGCDE